MRCQEGYHAACGQPARLWESPGAFPDDRRFILQVQCDLCGEIDAREFTRKEGIDDTPQP